MIPYTVSYNNEEQDPIPGQRSQGDRIQAHRKNLCAPAGSAAAGPNASGKLLETLLAQAELAATLPVQLETMNYTYMLLGNLARVEGSSWRFNSKHCKDRPWKDSYDGSIWKDLDMFAACAAHKK